MHDRNPNTSGPVRFSLSRESFRDYLAARPVGFVDSLRLYTGYCTAFCGRFLGGLRESAVGAVLPGRMPLTVSFRDIRAQVRPGTNDLDLLVHHEPMSLAWFRVSGGEIVVDVGAHIGRYTLLAAKQGATVFSIEPDPENFRVLESNVSLNRFRRVSLHPIALSNASGVRELSLASGTNRGMSSLSLPAGRSDSASRTSPRVPIDCVTLDGFINAEGIDRIDWLKVDVEGHEAEVLEGAAQALRITRHLILEVAAGNERPCQKRLEEAGFDLEAVERGFPASNWLLTRRS